MSGARKFTLALQGVAIMVVLISHYANSYASDFYNQWLFEYASAFIGLFFVLSGYGLYFSFERASAPG